MLRFQGVTRAFALAALKTKKQSPHIFFGVGVASIVSGGVMACKATLNLDETLDHIKEDIETVKQGQLVEADAYPEGRIEGSPDFRRLTTAVYVRGGANVVKLYGPAIILTGVGIACLTGSHIQLTRRNAALQATLAAVQTSFAEYRARMKEELGEGKENAIFRNLDGLGKDEAPTDRDPNKFSIYARVFDETNPNWKKDAELNRLHIHMGERYANHLLNSRGHVFLNEVYDQLGFDHSREGAIVGWVLSGTGDNYIDFGMMEVRNADFINGHERSVWLDFNVDGIIYDKI